MQTIIPKAVVWTTAFFCAAGGALAQTGPDAPADPNPLALAFEFRIFPNDYEGGQPLEVIARIDAGVSDGSITALGLTQQWPPGWQFGTGESNNGLVSASQGRLPDVFNHNRSTGTLEMAWTAAFQEFPVEFTYLMTPPLDAAGPATITGQVRYRRESIELVSNIDTVELFGQDVSPPVITLNPPRNMTIRAGQGFNDPGATATDNVDGDVSGNIVVSGNVNTGSAGTYQLSYDVSDSSGNQADTQVRTVRVLPRQETNNNGTGGVFTPSGPIGGGAGTPGDDGASGADGDATEGPAGEPPADETPATTTGGGAAAMPRPAPQQPATEPPARSSFSGRAPDVAGTPQTIVSQSARQPAEPVPAAERLPQRPIVKRATPEEALRPAPGQNVDAGLDDTEAVGSPALTKRPTPAEEGGERVQLAEADGATTPPAAGSGEPDPRSAAPTGFIASLPALTGQQITGLAMLGVALAVLGIVGFVAWRNAYSGGGRRRQSH